MINYTNWTPTLPMHNMNWIAMKLLLTLEKKSRVEQPPSRLHKKPC